MLNRKSVHAAALSAFFALTITGCATAPASAQTQNQRLPTMSQAALTPDQVRGAVTRYFEGTRSMNAAQWASAFAPNAVVQDPIAAPPLTTPEAIRAQGDGFVNAFTSVGLREVFVEMHADEAVAYWVGGGVQKDGARVRFEGINHFRFDANGKIVSLRGFWNPANIRAE